MPLLPRMASRCSRPLMTQPGGGALQNAPHHFKALPPKFDIHELEEMGGCRGWGERKKYILFSKSYFELQMSANQQLTERCGGGGEQTQGQCGAYPPPCVCNPPPH